MVGRGMGPGTTALPRVQFRGMAGRVGRRSTERADREIIERIW